MQKMKRIAWILLAFTVNSHAEFKDGNDLLSELESNSSVD
jgi:hypothetical protein